MKPACSRKSVRSGTTAKSDPGDFARFSGRRTDEQCLDRKCLEGTRDLALCEPTDRARSASTGGRPECSCVGDCAESKSGMVPRILSLLGVTTEEDTYWTSQRQAFDPKLYCCRANLVLLGN